MKHLLIRISRLFISQKNKKYKDLDYKQYMLDFGFITEKGEFKIKDEIKLKAAYERAWQNRDFEINKFWSRAAYFWGFIVLIFGGYIGLVTNNTLDKQTQSFLLLIFISLGIIFSFGWYLVIRGSKHWQENWEKHIDMLEDYVTGPLYKTIYYKTAFFSVSKVNEILSFLIILIWFGLLYYQLNKNNHLPCSTYASWKLDVQIFIVLIGTLLFLVCLIYGYSRKSYVNRKNGFIQRKPSI